MPETEISISPPEELRQAAEVIRAHRANRSRCWMDNLFSPDVAEAVERVLDRWAWLGLLDADLLNRVGGDEALALARAINSLWHEHEDCTPECPKWKGPR